VVGANRILGQADVPGITELHLGGSRAAVGRKISRGGPRQPGWNSRFKYQSMATVEQTGEAKQIIAATLSTRAIVFTLSISPESNLVEEAPVIG
jgi:hypothetical protein